jgi:hypothetical protein
MYFSIEVNLLNSLFAKFFFPASPAKGALNEEPTNWLDGARPAKTCTPPTSFPGNAPVKLCDVPTPKKIFASTKN